MRLQGLFCAALLLGLPAALHANATGGPYDLRRAGFSSGAGHSSGGPYELYGSLFRPDAHSCATAATSGAQAVRHAPGTKPEIV